MVAPIKSAVAATMNGMLIVKAAYLGKDGQTTQGLSARLNGEGQITEVAGLNPRIVSSSVAAGSMTRTAAQAAHAMGQGVTPL